MTDFFDHWMNESEENKKLVEKERLKLMKPIPTVEVQVRTVYELLKESRGYVQAVHDTLEARYDRTKDASLFDAMEKSNNLIKDIDDWMDLIEQDKLSCALMDLTGIHELPHQKV